MARKKGPAPDWFTCPVCGCEVRVGALACKECGADEQTGWGDETYLDGVELPPSLEPDIPDTFEEFVRRTKKTRRHTRTILIVVVALMVLAIVINAMYASLDGMG